MHNDIWAVGGSLRVPGSRSNLSPVNPAISVFAKTNILPIHTVIHEHLHIYSKARHPSEQFNKGSRPHPICGEHITI